MSNFEENINPNTTDSDKTDLEDQFTNRVILWYENDRGLCYSALDRAKNVLRNVRTEDDIPDHVQGVWSLEQTRTYRLADNLEDAFTDHMARIKDTTEPSGTFGSIAQEMITVASSAVNWEEIARRFLEDVKEQGNS